VEMQLSRPLFYALRYSRLFLQTPVPESLILDTREWQPPRQVLRLMDQLFSRSLVLRHTASRSLANNSARWLLYARSHWLSMPPLLLTRHLMYKSFTNRFSNR
jgi:hypothetical protein